MSRMKAALGLAMMYAALAGDTVTKKVSRVRDKKDTPEPPKKKIRPKSLKMFNIDGKEVWAINEKNAKRKAGK